MNLCYAYAYSVSAIYPQIFRTSLLNRISTQNPLRRPLCLDFETFLPLRLFVPQLIGIDKIQRQARIDKKYQSTEDIGIRQTFEQKTMRRNEMLRDMDLFSTYFSSSFLEPCPKLVLSDHSATNTQLAYDFLLHRRKLMMSIYHQLRASALYNFHSSELPTRNSTVAH